MHERLSEFSYGYGVTRAAENALASIGIRTTPFLPSLLHEGVLGFDASFQKPGAVLLLQFKLGQTLRRFVRSDTTQPAPQLDKPFWRFKIDTAEPDGQFELLLKAEDDGAEAYYVAPRFDDWNDYLRIYEAEEILDSSLLLQPSEIRRQLEASGQPDGQHRLAYDRTSCFVCSNPVRVREVPAAVLAEKLKSRVDGGQQTVREALFRIYEGFDRRSDIRRRPSSEQPVPGQMKSILSLISRDDPTPPAVRREDRQRRMSFIRERAKSEEDAVALALGWEAWAAGVQMVALTSAD